MYTCWRPHCLALIRNPLACIYCLANQCHHCRHRGQFGNSVVNHSALFDPWSQTGKANTPFDQPFYLILNVAVCTALFQTLSAPRLMIAVGWRHQWLLERWNGSKAMGWWISGRWIIYGAEAILWSNKALAVNLGWGWYPWNDREKCQDVERGNMWEEMTPCLRIFTLYPRKGAICGVHRLISTEPLVQPVWTLLHWAIDTWLLLLMWDLGIGFLSPWLHPRWVKNLPFGCSVSYSS